MNKFYLSRTLRNAFLFIALALSSFLQEKDVISHISFDDLALLVALDGFVPGSLLPSFVYLSCFYPRTFPPYIPSTLFVPAYSTLLTPPSAPVLLEYQTTLYVL